MELLLCAATEFEIQPTVRWIEKEKPAGIKVLITGVGLVATAYALTRQVTGKKPDLMVQAGIGGALDPALKLTEVVAVSSDWIGDLGVEETTFKTVVDMGFVDGNAHPFSGGRLRNEYPELQQAACKIVDGVSVNEISTRPGVIKRYQDAGAAVESMEGAAFHYVALLEKIPFLQMRSLSNFAGERNKKNWNIAGSIATLNDTLQTYLIKVMRL